MSDWRSQAARLTRWGLILAAFLVLELLVRTGVIDPRLVSPPTTIVSTIVSLVPTEQFISDLWSTTSTIMVSFGIGLAVGVALGVILGRAETLGRALEPYLVTLYALPTMVFYPMLLTIMGLGQGPIIIIATTMVVIPVTLGVMIALHSINPTLIKVGRSLNAKRLTLYLKIIGPAATPLAIPGLKLGYIYAVIWVVAMEFIVATGGLGYRIGASYRTFEVDRMYAYIVVVMALSIAANSILTQVERRVRRDML